MTRVLGLSAHYHDSAACLIEDGRIVAAAQEERFTRVLHDAAFPRHALRYCLAEAGPGRLDAVAFYDKPIQKLHRVLETAFAAAPRGLRSWLRAAPSLTQKKIWIAADVEEALAELGHENVPLYFAAHHESHAASAFFPSPFDEAAVLTMDGVGEWQTTTVGMGRGSELVILDELRFPHSLGLLYSAFTSFAGFEVNRGEYKLMGLAPYGEGRFTSVIREQLVDIKDDGSFRLNMEYFGYLDSLRMTNARFERLFGGPPRAPGAPITRREMDLARSVQEVTEEIVLKAARHAHRRTGLDRLCLAGGVALNCVANGRLVREGPFRDVWIQPAAGDAGGALGAALAVWHGALGKERPSPRGMDAMQGALLGPAFSDAQIAEFLDARGASYRRLAEPAWATEVAKLLAAERVVGLFQGRMEFGPRALGARSILADARSPRMQSVVNLKVKRRESFRPFAPAVLADRAREYFDLDRPSPYMLLVAQVREERRLPPDPDAPPADDLLARVNRPRSDIPAVTHVDYSARVQTVDPAQNPRFHALLQAFQSLTGCGVLLNTSFNVKDEPMVCTPEDALRCFLATDIDDLVIGSFHLRKEDQKR